jgi:hypothetical protein
MTTFYQTPCQQLTMTSTTLTSILTLALASAAIGREYHVSPTGNDATDGSPAQPLKTIAAAAHVAQPGDVITVHEGIYRERVNPPRGGESDDKRIVYQAAAGEKVVITGSEIVGNWQKVQDDTWKVTMPSRFFGDFNPYSDLIHGDWFSPNGRIHHTGAVYVNGDWLREAVRLEDVLKPAGDAPLWFATVDGASADYLLNVAWLRPGSQGAQLPAVGFAAKRNTQNAACTEGGQCVGFIKHGDWLRFDRVDFGSGCETLEFRAASASGGADIEIRLDTPAGELLGVAQVANTGDWQKWASFTAKIKPTSGAKTLCLVFRPHQSDTANTTIWAQFKGVDPNQAGVEINARQSVFYPSEPGRNFITVRGFTLEHAATPWAPPSAEQIGLLGTHWSKGWIIENNEIRYSKCAGIALGKYGDEFDNTNDAGAADPYTACVRRALLHGWNKATVGSHLVRNNHISHCEQTGIVGSLGCSFSTVTGNTIHDIHVHRLFSGADMGGIKFHGAVDVTISNNHIYRTGMAIWLDWMAQGTHVTGNLLHHNEQDLVLEVDHGPFLVANNLFLSGQTQCTSSRGGAYAHNLIAGNLWWVPIDPRLTPFHKPHSTEIAGTHNNPSGDVRYYNNLFVQLGDVSPYDNTMLPVWMAGNVFLKGTKPCKFESAPLLQPTFDPQLQLTEKPDGWYLDLTLDPTWATRQNRQLVTTEMLGKASVPDQPFENADGSPLRIDTDYFGNKRNEANPFPGPLERPATGKQSLKVWPLPTR